MKNVGDVIKLMHFLCLLSASVVIPAHHKEIIIMLCARLSLTVYEAPKKRRNSIKIGDSTELYDNGNVGQHYEETSNAIKCNEMNSRENLSSTLLSTVNTTTSNSKTLTR